MEKFVQPLILTSLSARPLIHVTVLGKHKDRGKWKNGASNNNKAASMKVDSKGSEDEIETIGGINRIVSAAYTYDMPP